MSSNSGNSDDMEIFGSGIISTIHNSGDGETQGNSHFRSDSSCSSFFFRHF
eukprot:NODE_2358_length_566_cov_127.812379_g1869_i0.p4 GENE.NODE_2358_length_566_cov_127.812379_g1869_i0~~NODE_2358_length_566_cov_127.812379_g1869_i0.p4  ORF type:complete len:51 (-),score=3.15 NODE_2358_length_566_cov_127.812379_g1869_i0:55-207(-)